LLAKKLADIGSGVGRARLASVKSLSFDPNGLIPAIVQDRLTGQVRMLAWMNSAALEQTLATGKATFFSRSRQALWVKGETSGNLLTVKEVVADCDADTLLLLVDPVGPSCHTAVPAAFSERFGRGSWSTAAAPRLHLRKSSSEPSPSVRARAVSGVTRVPCSTAAP
jgi:phosphoribosyl-AMP cyclohydrolase